MFFLPYIHLLFHEFMINYRVLLILIFLGLCNFIACGVSKPLYVSTHTGGGARWRPPTMGCFLAHSVAYIGFLIYFFFCVIVIQKLKIAFFWIKNYVSSSLFFTPLCASTHGGARWRPLPWGVFFNLLHGLYCSSHMPMLRRSRVKLKLSLLEENHVSSSRFFYELTWVEV